MPRASAFVHTSDVAYLPSYDGTTHFFKATVTNVATRLADLVAIPSLLDETYMGSAASATGKTIPVTRPPYHVFFQVPSAAANPVYMTWDNVTTPVVGGPGVELNVGVILKMENAGDVLLRPSYQMIGGYSPTARYLVNAKTAFQFVATANTSLLVWFTD
jgi:hypothetical protein